MMDQNRKLLHGVLIGSFFHLMVVVIIPAAGLAVGFGANRLAAGNGFHEILLAFLGFLVLVLSVPFAVNQCLLLACTLLWAK